MFKHTYNQYELLYFRTHNLYEKNEFMNGKIETSVQHAKKKETSGVWIIYPGNSEIVVGASARVNRTWTHRYVMTQTHDISSIYKTAKLNLFKGIKIPFKRSTGQAQLGGCISSTLSQLKSIFLLQKK